MLHQSINFQSKFKILDVFFLQNDTSGETTLTASKLENTCIARSDVSKTATDSECHGWFLVAAVWIHTEMIYYHYSQHSHVNDYEPPTDPVINPRSWLKYLPSATKLRRLCFYTCLWFCSQGGGCYIPACLAAGGSAPGWGLLRGADPPQSRRLLLRTVRMLLECILVPHIIVGVVRKNTSLTM